MSEAPLTRGRSFVRIFRHMLVLAWLIVLVMAPPASGQPAAPESVEELIEDVVGHDSKNGFYTWLDDYDSLITYTAITPAVGDSYIDADNRLFEVVSVDDDRTVRVKLLEQLELPRVSTSVSSRATAGWLGAQVEDRDSGPIGIYHSHNAESYVETSNQEFKEPHGDIIEVGRALQQSLEEQGYRVIHSENSHLPHDGGAYQRSRGTVRELLEQGAIALIDVHRDAIPAEVYRTEVEGEEMTKVRLVVGRQNPNRDANLELAKRIKSMADEKYPGLIKGIFNARGNYNQDIGPRAILLEFGTHETSLDEAVRSTKFIAEIFPAAAGLATGTRGAADAQIGGAGLRSALWFALLAAALVFGYLWVNEGSPKAAWNRILNFFRREMGRVGVGSDGDTGEGPDGGSEDGS